MSKKTIKTLILYAIAIAIIAVFTAKFVDWVTQPISEGESDEYCGEALLWDVDKKKMVISGTGEMFDFSEKSVPWTAGNKKAVTTIIIEEGVTSIGAYAFEGFNSLKKVELPSTLTHIDPYAFHWCKSLETIELPDSVTEIGAFAFAECRKLTSVTLSDNLSVVAPNAFLLCESLANIDFGRGVSEIGEYAFGNCYALTDVTLPASLKKIGPYAFHSCYMLSNVNLDKVSEISDGAFQSTACDAAILLEGCTASVSDTAFFNTKPVSVSDEVVEEEAVEEVVEESEAQPEEAQE